MCVCVCARVCACFSVRILWPEKSTGNGGSGWISAPCRPAHLQLLQLPLPCLGPRRHYFQMLSGAASSFSSRLFALVVDSCFYLLGEKIKSCVCGRGVVVRVRACACLFVCR